MARAMTSDRTKPLAPSKAGILPEGFSLVYSADLLNSALELGSVRTNSRSKSLLFAATRTAMVRPFSYTWRGLAV